ncbi:NAD(P)H-dependent oxidoreductase [Listeria grayi]|uniref:Flavodoxin-like protein n=2 Tax=Listeria grayi TaxID=1641 RepID=D7UV04_LISGR|nr:NAD(P)H-dependent oxidoreductase [Listeria grayi]EFI85080.1 flavodoxin-like protein [Listeria grayi DSM 20601]STY44714.1 FMN-dependent NADH-azoreductase 2 [Listeria grayi]
MNFLIIYAHPNHESLNYAILQKVTANLSQQHTIKVLDLYAENYDPLLHFGKDKKRRDLYLDETTKAERTLVEWADHLVFIFPIWWGGMPAILKGFIDKVFVKDFAYAYKGVRPVGLLPGKRAWIINTHDTPSFYAHLVQQDYGKVLKKQVLNMCGIKPVTHTTCSYIRGSSLKKRTAFLKKVEQISKTL